MCLLYKKKNKLYSKIYNLGDSRSVMCNKNNISQQLSLDHKPNTYYEKKRIENMGGKIYVDTENEWRVGLYSL